jgi:hypothetical protein
MPMTEARARRRYTSMCRIVDNGTSRNFFCVQLKIPTWVLTLEGIQGIPLLFWGDASVHTRGMRSRIRQAPEDRASRLIGRLGRRSPAFRLPGRGVF